MRTTPEERIAQQIARVAKRAGQYQARELLRDLQRSAREREEARRKEARRKYVLGGAVVAAGCGEWVPAEIVGVLLDAQDRVSNSPTMRLGLRKRGEQHMGTGAGSALN